MQPWAAYWTTMLSELVWPFAPEAARRPPAELWRRRLEEIGQAGGVPLHDYAVAREMPACVRDALGMLAIAALVPRHRVRANLKSPWSPAIECGSLESWAMRTSQERRCFAVWFGRDGVLGRDDLITHHGDEVAATTALLELVAQSDWPASPSRGAFIPADRDAFIGAADEHAISKLAVTVSALRDAIPIVHLIGPRGSGRLRVVSSVVARAGTPRMLVVREPSFIDAPGHLDGALVEAHARGAELVLANVDDIGSTTAALIADLARARRMTVWTTSERKVRWSASALAWTMPDASPQQRREAWQAELERRSISIDATILEELGELRAGRHAIALTVEAVARIYRDRAPLAALTEIANHFTEGACDGL